MTLPKILATKQLSESRLFNVEEVHLEFSNGEQRFFERVSLGHAGAVMIVPMLDDETLLLIREYAVGVEGYVLGFAKGAMDEGEDALATANRELMEEVGYGANNLQVMTEFSSIPGYLRSSMHVVLAQDLYQQTAEGDEPEPIEVVPWKLDNVDALLAHPEFVEARSIAALLMTERHFYAKQHR